MDDENNEPSPAVIRNFRTRDYEALLALWDAAGLPYKPKGRDARAEIERQTKEPTAIYLVAEADGEIVGAVLGTHDGRKGWINRLAVLPDYRRRNVGATLVAEVERRLAAAGVDIFACFIEDGNDGSKAFFDELGYKRSGGISYYTKKKRDDV